MAIGSAAGAAGLFLVRTDSPFLLVSFLNRLPGSPVHTFIVRSVVSSLPHGNSGSLSDYHLLQSGGCSSNSVEVIGEAENKKEDLGARHQPLRRERRNRRAKEMTNYPFVNISSDGVLRVRGRTLLTGVPDNVTVSSTAGAGPVDGVFLGVSFEESASRQIVSLGNLRSSHDVQALDDPLMRLEGRLNVLYKA